MNYCAQSTSGQGDCRQYGYAVSGFERVMQTLMAAIKVVAALFFGDVVSLTYVLLQGIGELLAQLRRYWLQ
jgi:hypothetical protein